MFLVVPCPVDVGLARSHVIEGYVVVGSDALAVVQNMKSKWEHSFYTLFLLPIGFFGTWLLLNRAPIFSFRQWSFWLRHSAAVRNEMGPLHATRSVWGLGKNRKAQEEGKPSQYG